MVTLGNVLKGETVFDGHRSSLLLLAYFASGSGEANCLSYMYAKIPSYVLIRTSQSLATRISLLKYAYDVKFRYLRRWMGTTDIILLVYWICCKSKYKPLFNIILCYLNFKKHSQGFGSMNYKWVFEAIELLDEAKDKKTEQNGK